MTTVYVIKTPHGYAYEGWILGQPGTDDPSKAIKFPTRDDAIRHALVQEDERAFPFSYNHHKNWTIEVFEELPKPPTQHVAPQGFQDQPAHQQPVTVSREIMLRNQLKELRNWCNTKLASNPMDIQAFIFCALDGEYARRFCAANPTQLELLRCAMAEPRSPQPQACDLDGPCESCQ